MCDTAPASYRSQFSAFENLEEELQMSLVDRAHEARERAGASINPFDHRLALALQGAVDAERIALDRSLDPAAPVDDLPKWSEVCPEGDEWLWG